MNNYINIRRIIDVQSQISPVSQSRRNFSIPVFIYKGVEYSGNRTTLFTGSTDVTKAYGSNTEQSKAAPSFFGGGFNGLHPTNCYFANFNDGSEVWANVITELLSDPRYYHVLMDGSFTDVEKEAMATAINASTKLGYHGWFLDTNPIAASTTLDNDVTSLAKSLYTGNSAKNICFYDEIANVDQYLHMGAVSYFGVVDFTAARPLGNLAFKDPGLKALNVSNIDTIVGNLEDKHCNYYGAFGESGRNIINPGISCDGSATWVQVGFDWLDYQMTYDIFEFMKTIDSLQYTTGDFSKLDAVLATRLESAKAAKIIAPGTDSLTGKVYPNGYDILIPSPNTISAADKSAGLLPNIIVEAIISGKVRKFSVTNKLNY